MPKLIYDYSLTMRPIGLKNKYIDHMDFSVRYHSVVSNLSEVSEKCDLDVVVHCVSGQKLEYSIVFYHIEPKKVPVRLIKWLPLTTMKIEGQSHWEIHTYIGTVTQREYNHIDREKALITIRAANNFWQALADSQIIIEDHIKHRFGRVDQLKEELAELEERDAAS